MAIDRLQDKIRKMKNPTVINMSFLDEHIPVSVTESAGQSSVAHERYTSELLDALKEIIPAVRFSFSAFALKGADGLDSLKQLLNKAKDLGYYVFLDAPDMLSAQDATQAARYLMDPGCPWYFDGLVISSYIGSDGLKPYIHYFGENDKDIFVVVRTANKTATELQDLMTGTRLMHTANADIVNRFTQPYITRCSYSRVAAMAGASSAESLRTLREKYRDIFLLVDGCDYPNANAKNCSYAFDRLGHGAVACAGLSIIAAWRDSEEEYLTAAVEAAHRLRKNLLRYITIL